MVRARSRTSLRRVHHELSVPLGGGLRGRPPVGWLFPLTTDEGRRRSLAATARGLDDDALASQLSFAKHMRSVEGRLLFEALESERSRRHEQAEMTRFTVRASAVYTVTVTIEAESEADAIEQATVGRGQLVDQTFDYLDFDAGFDVEGGSP